MTLCDAVKNSRLASVMRLAEAGASVNNPNAEGYTPLHLAADAGNARIVGYLLSSGAESNAVTGDRR